MTFVHLPKKVSNKIFYRYKGQVLTLKLKIHQFEVPCYLFKLKFPKLSQTELKSIQAESSWTFFYLYLLAKYAFFYNFQADYFFKLNIL